MAKLKSHGPELLRLEYLSCSKSYRADGHILKNSGDGWKLHRRVKDGVNIPEHIEHVRRTRAEKEAACPVFTKYRRLLTQYPLETRVLIHQSLSLMPTDPDGVWSTLDDYGKRADLDDLVELSRLHETALKELEAYNKRVREQQAAAKAIGEPGLPNFVLQEP